MHIHTHTEREREREREKSASALGERIPVEVQEAISKLLWTRQELKEAVFLFLFFFKRYYLLLAREGMEKRANEDFIACV